MKTNRNNSILSLWQSLPDSKSCGPVESIFRSVERPELALVHGTDGELYALLDTVARRVLDEEEFPTTELETLTWLPRWMIWMFEEFEELRGLSPRERSEQCARLSLLDDLTPQEQQERREALKRVPEAMRAVERVIGPEEIARINAKAVH
jgi:hypothetical protein